MVRRSLDVSNDPPKRKTSSPKKPLTLKPPSPVSGLGANEGAFAAVLVLEGVHCVRNCVV